MSTQARALSIKQNMLWNSVGSLTNLGCQWVITVLVVRLASDYEIAGIYSLAMAIFNMFSQIAQYKMYTVQISDVRNDNSVGEYFTFRLITVGASMAVLALYALATCRLSVVPAIVLYAIYKSAGLIIDVMHASDQVGHRMDYIGKSLIMQGVCALSSFVVVFGVLGSLEGALVLMSVATVAIGAVYDYPRSVRIAPIKLGISRQKAVSLALGCLPIVLAGAAVTAAPSIPRQYLSSVMGDSALGVYASVAAPVAIIQMGATYVYNPLLSYLVERYLDKNRQSFYGLIKKIVLGIIGVGAACSVALLFVGEFFLVLLYGDSISEYVYLLQPMILCAFLTGLAWFINDLLVALKNYRGVFIGSAFSLASAIATMVPCVAVFGLNGVTVTNIISSVVCLGYQAVVLAMQTGKWFGAADRSSDG